MAKKCLGFSSIRPGDRVTILVPSGIGRHGQEYTQRSGTVVMSGPAGWVLDMGGRHGTPAIASRENFVCAKRGKPLRVRFGRGR